MSMGRINTGSVIAFGLEFVHGLAKDMFLIQNRGYRDRRIGPALRPWYHEFYLRHYYMLIRLLVCTGKPTDQAFRVPLVCRDRDQDRGRASLGQGLVFLRVHVRVHVPCAGKKETAGI